MATTIDCNLVNTTNIPIKISNRIKIRAKYDTLVCLDWSLRKIIVMVDIDIALMMASNL